MSVRLNHNERYAKHAGVASKRQAGRYCIEGALVTLADIGARIGVSESMAGARLKREQQCDGPVTWAGLSK